MFENRRGHKVVLKRTLDGNAIIKFVSRASEWRLKREIARIYRTEEKRPSRAPKMLNSDSFYEQWKADNENNLIDLERKS
jgi:hypothetical protein